MVGHAPNTFTLGLGFSEIRWDLNKWKSSSLEFAPGSIPVYSFQLVMQEVYNKGHIFILSVEECLKQLFAAKGSSLKQ